MPARFGNIQLLGAIHGGQHWQCPPPTSKRKLYRDSQHHPTVSPTKDHMVMGRIDSIVMTTLAVHTFAPVLSRGVVHRDQHRFVGWDLTQYCPSQNSAQGPQLPGRTGKDPMVGTGMSSNQASHCPEYCGDGSSAHGQYGSDGQRKNSLDSWLSKCYRKTHEKRLCLQWNRKHIGLLSDLLTVFISKNRQESVFCANNLYLVAT